MKLSAAEAATLDRIRGSMKRGAYLRHLLVSSEEPKGDPPTDGSAYVNVIPDQPPEREQPVAPVSNEPAQVPQARPASTPRRITAARPPAPPSRQECRHPGRMRFGTIGNRTCRVCGTKGLP